MNKAPAYQFYPGDYIQDTRVLSLAARGAWQDLLCFMWRSDERGKLSYSIEGYARLFGVSVDETKQVINELITLKICDSVTECNGNVTLINRRMVRDETIRNQTKNRVKRHRNAQEKRKCNENVTLHSSSSSSKEKQTKRKKRPSPSGDCASAFELFWSSYPKKRSKGDAEKAWIQINPSEHLIEKILSAVQRAKTSVDWTKENGRYIPYPASWLRSKGWEDEYTQPGCEQPGNDRPSTPVPVRTYRDSDGNVRDVRTGEIIEPTDSGISEQPGPALAIVKDLVTDLTGTGLRMVN